MSARYALKCRDPSIHMDNAGLPQILLKGAVWVPSRLALMAVLYLDLNRGRPARTHPCLHGGIKKFCLSCYHPEMRQHHPQSTWTLDPAIDSNTPFSSTSPNMPLQDTCPTRHNPRCIVAYTAWRLEAATLSHRANRRL